MSRWIVFESPHEDGYRDRATYLAGDRVARATWQDVEIEIAELFPPRALLTPRSQGRAAERSEA